MPRGLNAYVLAHFVATLPLAIGLLAAAKSLSRGELVVPAALVLWALLNIGGILDHRRWALPSELLRLPVTAAMLAAWLPDGPWLAPAQASLALAVVASWLCLLIYRRQFDGTPQLPSRVIELSWRPRASGLERIHDVVPWFQVTPVRLVKQPLMKYLVEQSLMEYAESRSFNEPPPDRTD